MKRKIAQAFITAALISSMAVSPVFATPSVEDLQNDKAAAEDEVVSLQSELTGILDKISTLEADLQKKLAGGVPLVELGVTTRKSRRRSTRRT